MTALEKTLQQTVDMAEIEKQQAAEEREKLSEQLNDLGDKLSNTKESAKAERDELVSQLKARGGWSQHPIFPYLTPSATRI